VQRDPEAAEGRTRIADPAQFPIQRSPAAARAKRSDGAIAHAEHHNRPNRHSPAARAKRSDGAIAHAEHHNRPNRHSPAARTKRSDGAAARAEHRDP